MHIKTLSDTRPYPHQPVKRELLQLAHTAAHSSNPDEQNQARQALFTKINSMFQIRHTLGFSIAVTMTPDEKTYAELTNTLEQTLNAQNDDEVQWFALPVIIVAGSKEAATLKMETPVAELNACLATSPQLRSLTQATWLPHLIRADDFAKITADEWYEAKQNDDAAQQFAAKLPQSALPIPPDQSVHALYALGYGSKNIQAALGKSLNNIALPLMQVWQEYLTESGLTLFTNPLSPNSPTAALADANHMRLRMALDVFSANAIRAVRLQSPRVGVVMAAQEGGRLLFGFNAVEGAYDLQQQVFVWPLSPRENIAIVQQNFLDLMVDCQIEYIRQLEEPIAEGKDLPTFSKAIHLAGFNPLFPDQSISETDLND